MNCTACLPRSKSIGELVTRYLEKVSPDKASYVTDKSIIKNFLTKDIAKKSISLTTQDAASYRDERLKAVSPSTVRREINTIQYSRLPEPNGATSIYQTRSVV